MIDPPRTATTKPKSTKGSTTNHSGPVPIELLHRCLAQLLTRQGSPSSSLHTAARRLADPSESSPPHRPQQNYLLPLQGKARPLCVFRRQRPSPPRHPLLQALAEPSQAADENSDLERELSLVEGDRCLTRPQRLPDQHRCFVDIAAWHTTRALILLNDGYVWSRETDSFYRYWVVPI